MTLLSSSTLGAAFVDASSGGASDLQILSSTPPAIYISSDGSPSSVGGADSKEWSDDKPVDFGEGDFDGINVGEARDLGLKSQVVKRKQNKPTCSYS